MRQLLFFVLCLTALLACSCGGGKDSQTSLSLSDNAARSAPAFEAELAGSAGAFPAGLPDDGSFNPGRVTALASVSLDGSAFDSSSANVTADGSLGQFSGSGELEWAMWRFEATTADSISEVRVALDNAAEGADIWYAIADYSAQEWDWLGNGADLANSFGIAGTTGQHSSPAGYVYIAVVHVEEAGFSVQSVQLDYGSRYSISGRVVDDSGAPVEGVLVTTNLADAQQTFTDANGAYSLSHIPEGDWAVMVAAYGFRFHGDMQVASVSGADVSDLDFWGIRDFTLLRAEDSHEPNDEAEAARPMDASGLSATLSIYNDEEDYYSFEAAAPGWHYLRIDAEHSVLFPYVNLLLEDDIYADFSSQVIYGVNYVGYYLPVAGSYLAEVGCEGGGGAYSLELGEGELTHIDGRVFDEDDENFPDEEYEEPYGSIVELAFPDFSMYILNSGSGYFDHSFIPPLAATISASRPLYTITPAELLHDFSSGPLEDADFDLEHAVLVDPDEPNNDFASATQLSLPLAVPYEGMISYYSSDPRDIEDYYRFTLGELKNLRVRLRHPGLLAEQSENLVNLRLFDATETSVDIETLQGPEGLEIRTVDPLTPGEYYLRVSGADDGQTEYNFLLDAFDQRSLTFRTFMNAEPVSGVEVVWYLEDVGHYSYEEIYSGERMMNCDFVTGERVFYTFRRYGLDIHEAGGYVVIGDADAVVEPQIGYAGDSNEPNDTLALAKPLSYPVDINATLSGEEDRDDYYDFESSSLDIRVAITADKPGADFTLRLTPDGSFSSISTGEIRGSGECYLRTDSSGAYTLHIETFNYQGEYRLEIADSVAYKISGTIDHGKPGESYYSAPIINLTTLDIVTPQSTSGEYVLGYYPPGTYSIMARMANHTMSPSAPVDVVITNADVDLDFTATYNNQDSMEPNDTDDTAGLITLPADFNATTDYENTVDPEDRHDWYTFTAASDGLLRVTLSRNWLHPPNNFYCDLFDGVNFSDLARSKAGGTNMLNEYLEFPVESGQQYWIHVYGSGDNRYKLEADIF